MKTMLPLETMTIQIVFIVVSYIAIAILPLTGCATLFSKPQPIDTPDGFSKFPSTKAWPIEKSVKIYWSENKIPFIEAETDSDCAFTIGVVHAYLRLGQMEIFKRDSAGRLSESAGPIATPKIDEILRRLDLGRANQKSYEMLKPNDKAWLDRYIDGINFYLAQTEDLPYEFEFLNLKKESWSFNDSLRIGRLAGGDANWSNLFSFLELRNNADWESVWNNQIDFSKESIPSGTAAGQLDFQNFMSVFSRTGSNSVVVSRKKSQTKSSMIASDPHLGIFVPNLWLLMGYKSPSYHTVGYMLPGVPAVTIGRNAKIAWGGTYMRGTSSLLFEVRPDQITGIRKEVIKRRFWFDKTVEIKESVFGPVVFDGINPLTKKTQMIALSWVGHQPSNELGSFLNANRAANWSEFKEGFLEFAVSGLNITYADKDGNIGFLPAIRQPLLKDNSEYDLLVKSSTNSIESYRNPLDLPSTFNPTSGFIVSANNIPFITNPPLARVFAQNDRFKRWSQLLDSNKSLTAKNLKAWQQDVFSQDSLDLSRLILADLKNVPKELEGYYQRIQNWDGQFNIESEGAPAFEILARQLAENIVDKSLYTSEIKKKFLDSEDWRYWLILELKKINPSMREKLITDSMQSTKMTVLKFKTWGDFHYQKVQTPLGLIPVLGSRFSFGDYPSPGSASTIHKAAFSIGKGRRPVIFGAQARHISDLSDLDENFFIMLGGNDGWLYNKNMIDQISLWRKGEYLKIPLSLEGISKSFTTRTDILQPKPQAK